MNRDLAGYRGNPPAAQWPGGARVALQFVLNLEEGAENTILNGDQGSEAYLHEMPGRPARIGERDLSVESTFEYGSRSGVWRILELFDARQLPLTIFATGLALEGLPELGRLFRERRHEVAGHGYRWIDYHRVPESVEREHIIKTIEVIKDCCGERPVGWYTGRISPNTSRLLGEIGGFLYSSDSYADDLPYWRDVGYRQLVVPYTLVNNDARYLIANGFSGGDDFLRLLTDGFEQLLSEGAKSPKMMTVGLHARISGQPARARALARFLDLVRERDDVWICRRADIARHWIALHP